MIPLLKNENMVIKDKCVFFFLEQENSDVHLIAQDENGEQWYVIQITPCGIALHHSVRSSSGIPIDEHGRVLILPEDAT